MGRLAPGSWLLVCSQVPPGSWWPPGHQGRSVLPGQGPGPFLLLVPAAVPVAQCADPGAPLCTPAPVPSQPREAPAQLCLAGQAPRLRRRRGNPGLSLSHDEDQDCQVVCRRTCLSRRHGTAASGLRSLGAGPSCPESRLVPFACEGPGLGSVLFFKIYLFCKRERDCVRAPAGEGQREREKQTPDHPPPRLSREPDTGLDPRTPGS